VTRFEVAIVGAGPAGLATALFLVDREPRLAGRVAVFERATLPRDKPCAGALGGRGEKLLAAVGVGVDAIPHVRIRGMSVRYAAGAREHRSDDLGCVVGRADFDHLLARTARLRGVAVFEGHGVRAMREDASGVALDTDGGTYAARCLVGADGVGSFVRRWLGLPHGTLHAHAIEVDTPPVAGDPGADVLHFDASDAAMPGYAWDFPTPAAGDRAVCRGVFALSRPGAAPVRASQAEGWLRDRLRAKGLRLEDYPTRRSVERGYERHRAYGRGQVMLVGEAAGIDPIAGEGIAQAIEYGSLAARYLVERLRGGEGFDGWAGWFARTRLGVDLAVRERVVPLAHGRLRGWLERAMVATPAGLAVSSSAFAGAW
jgi:flavin-dependent dehydrogenase